LIAKADTASDLVMSDSFVKVDMWHNGFRRDLVTSQHEPTETPEAPMQPTDRLNASGAAEFLDLSTKTLANMRARGIGPPSYRIGGRVWYDLRDLNVWIAREKAATLVGA